MSFEESIAGALVMGPMTKGSNLPYRRLCVELGARVLVSEMTVARRLKQKRRGEFALIRRAPEEPMFGVQLCGNNPDELAWAAALVESRGADFVDLNLGCPIDHFTRKGLGAALGRQPKRVRRIVEAMRAAVKVPVTVKIRLGWKSDERNYLDVARAAVDGGAGALTVHGRTREARYRHPADWEAIADVAREVSVPVIGNGDLLFPHEVHERLQSSGCAAVMSARGVLIKPWLFREAITGDYWDITADERLAIYRRYVELALDHWEGDGGVFHSSGRSGDTGPLSSRGPDALGPGVLENPGSQRSEPAAERADLCPPASPNCGKHLRPREFLRWHVGFWVRYVPRRADGTWPTMQERESFVPRSPLEALFSRTDDVALDYITDELLNAGDFSSPPPSPAAGASQPEPVEAG